MQYENRKKINIYIYTRLMHSTTILIINVRDSKLRRFYTFCKIYFGNFHKNITRP